MRALFPPGEEFVFDTTILFLAGNHDHHLWRSVQDQQFIEQIERLVQQIEGNDGVSQTKEGVESWLGMAGKGAIPQLLVDRLDAEG